MLPFNPQPTEELKARFPKALECIYDWEGGQKLRASDRQPIGAVDYRQGPLHDHVFDFKDGLRLIVTQDLEEDGKVFLHLSAGAQPGTQVMNRFSYTGREGQAVFKDLALRRYREISGDKVRLFFDEFLPNGAAHWRRRILEL